MNKLLQSKNIQVGNHEDKWHGYLARNLQKLMNSSNLNANQLGQILDVPMMTIRRLLSGETTDPRISTLKLIADYFKVSVDSLIEKELNLMKESANICKPNFIPKIDWDTAKSTTSFNDIDMQKWENWHSISVEDKSWISEKAFALESRPSIYPRFPKGTVFIFDPTVTPRDGDLVLVKLKSNQDLTVRELIIDPPEYQLHSTVGQHILNFNETEHEIIGVNLFTMFYSRKN